MKSVAFAAIAIASGLVVLIGNFVNLPVLVSAREHFLTWAMMVAAIATWVGAANLLSVHWKKVRGKLPGTSYSIVLIAAFFLTLLGGIAENILQPGTQPLQAVINSVQVPVEGSLMALLTVILIFAGVVLVRRRQDVMVFVFLASALVFLLLGSGLVPLLNVPFLQNLADSVNRLPLAGARGILLGVALGSLATGIRILLGADRPYEG